MTLTTKQEEGLKIAVQRYHDDEPYTIISGFAGAGKSTLIRFIIAALDIPEEDVVYIAYTGKAAEVLRHKGCPNAMTAHKFLYYSDRLPNGKFIFKPRKALEFRPKIIVVDEVSMLPKSMWDLLLSHHIHVLACGDPGQLPPVNKDDLLTVLDNPHIFLDEIMRQAQESEIIRLSMDVRDGRPLQYFKGNEVQVIHPNEIITGMYDWADEILTATNKKRQEINSFIREMKGYGDEPQVGDKVISLCNHWDCLDYSYENALINGTIGYISEGNFPVTLDYFDPMQVPRQKSIPLWRLRETFPKPVPTMTADIVTETGERFDEICMDYEALMTGKRCYTPQQEWYYTKFIDKDIQPYEFNYGYAITVHRAQGSEWDKVMVFEENFPFDREEHKKWLYTAVTRASSRLVLVR